MRPSRRFTILQKSAYARIHRLRRLAAIACNRPCAEFAIANRELSYVVIELHTAIANFTRTYFLLCSLNPITKSGTRVTCAPHVRCFVDAIDAAMKACKHRVWAKACGGKAWDRRDEPAWHLPATLIDSSHQILCSHHPNILAAFALPTTVFDHLTKFRNFCAHRNDSTSDIAQGLAFHYSIPPTQHPMKILCTPGYGRPQSVILDWVDDTLNVIELLCH